MKDSESKEIILIPSIFCKIKNRPKKNEYPDKFCFEKISLDTISYPKSIGSLKLNPYPEENKIEKAKRHVII